MEIIAEIWLFLVLESARINENSSNRHKPWLDWISPIQNVQVFPFQQWSHSHIAALWVWQDAFVSEHFCGITEPLKLERSWRIIESSHAPNSTVFIPAPCPQVPHSGMVTPALLCLTTLSVRKSSLIPDLGKKTFFTGRVLRFWDPAGVWWQLDFGRKGGESQAVHTRFWEVQKLQRDLVNSCPPLLLCSKREITPKALEFALHPFPWIISQKAWEISPLPV